MQPPTEQELEFIGQITVATVIASAMLLVLVIAYSGYLVFKTSLPGRFEVFFGSCLIAIFYLWTLYMGGYLEMTFGPVGQLLNIIAWSTALCFFLAGHLRMLRNFRGVERGN